jgi:hypothetical protein
MPLGLSETRDLGTQITQSLNQKSDVVRGSDNPSLSNHLPASRDIVLNHSTTPLKNTHTFIEIHKPSGKTDSDAGSNVRSHIMRKHHDNRRRHGMVKTTAKKRSRKDDCPHVEVDVEHAQRPSMTGPLSNNISQEIPATRNRQDLLPDLLERSFTATDLKSPASYMMESQGFVPMSTGEVECVQCGRLLLQYLPNNGEMVLGASFGGPQDLLGSNSRDLFDSLAIKISHRMHCLLHHCKRLHI